MTVTLMGERRARPGELDPAGRQGEWRGVAIELARPMTGLHISDVQLLGFFQGKVCAMLDCTPADVHWRCHPRLTDADVEAIVRRLVPPDAAVAIAHIDQLGAAPPPG